MPDLTEDNHSSLTPSSEVEELLEAAYAPNTRRAYRSDIASFVEWGGSIPATPEQLAAFIAFRANVCTVATIKRQLASISSLHASLGISRNPVKSLLVTSAVRGLHRLHGRPQRGVDPLLIEHLREILATMPDTRIGMRDSALLTIGFAGAMRRSELVSLDIDDIEHVPEGIWITLKRSKTDQTGRGRTIAVPYGRTRYCPVKYLNSWTDELGADTGALFRPCIKGGSIQNTRLSPEAVATTIKKHVARIGLDPGKYSGHALRAGYVTSAIQAGASEHSIRRQTGHASSASMERYIRLASLFEDNPTGLLF